MGASLVYLDEPNKNIEWAEGEDAKATFACGEMQGWRLNMVSVLTMSDLVARINDVLDFQGSIGQWYGWHTLWLTLASFNPTFLSTMFRFL